MTQQLNTQVFAYAKQFADSAFKAQSVALKALEQVTELQLKAFEQQARGAADFVAQAAEVRDLEALRGLWEKGANLSRDHAEQAAAVGRDIIAVSQKTAESLGALAQAQQQAANDAVAAPAAGKKAAAK
ncbi:phasin family protein [Rhodanobacter glycinis]|uniref:Phasin family protein n=1 Tax=Rhodanobacter glycinis TaxID=582702 RepID=A0A5B9DXN8_9GAMM|nr:phasin family protein [Rhodanobacter glycinis]QEE23421.1 phasin family protein [Rhodanobacter glycinis]